MLDLERFESRLTTALRAYGEEVPTEVDAASLAHGIATRRPRRAWLDALAGSVPWPAIRVARTALVVVALVALLIVLAIVGQRILQGPTDVLVDGRVGCVAVNPGERSAADGAGRTSGIVLECLAGLSDDRVSGAMTLTVTRTDGPSGTTFEAGTVGLRTSSGAWAGELIGQTAVSGTSSTSMRLIGSGRFRGLTLDLHLVSSDGLAWRALGIIVPSERP